MDVMDRIKETIENNHVVIFMKGSPDMPQCGFSMQTSQALKACNVEFAYVDVLADPEVRSGLKTFSNWPTFPQLYVNGELIGGCDITLDLYQKGELQALLQDAVKATTQ